MIEVTCDITIYERAGKEQGVDKPKLVVGSHWNRSGFVVLQDGNAEPITVAARDLIAAIANATNTGR